MTAVDTCLEGYTRKPRTWSELDEVARHGMYDILGCTLRRYVSICTLGRHLDCCCLYQYFDVGLWV